MTAMQLNLGDVVIFLFQQLLGHCFERSFTVSEYKLRVVPALQGKRKWRSHTHTHTRSNVYSDYVLAKDVQRKINKIGLSR